MINYQKISHFFYKTITVNKFPLYTIMIFFAISNMKGAIFMYKKLIDNLNSEIKTDVSSEEFYEDLEYYEDSTSV